MNVIVGTLKYLLSFPAPLCFAIMIEFVVVISWKKNRQIKPFQSLTVHLPLVWFSKLDCKFSSCCTVGIITWRSKVYRGTNYCNGVNCCFFHLSLYIYIYIAGNFMFMTFVYIMMDAQCLLYFLLLRLWFTTILH